jgi:7-cyano-7-deazaguanine synthase in queuosine biosynthesis
MATLITLSGGLDSVYVLWQHLKDNPKEKTFVFHVELRHKAEDRLQTERVACQKIVQELQKMGLKKFRYIEGARFDYGDFPRITIKDIQIVAIFKAILLKTEHYGEIDTIKFGWHKGEVNRNDIDKGFRVRKVFEALEVNREIKFEFPIENMTRKDMVEQLPPELLKHVRSCRKPTFSKPCGRCATCREYLDVGLQPL